MMNDARRCPEPQVLQAFVEGRATAQQRRSVLEHLEGCDACMSAVDLANEVHREETPAAQTRWWLAVAAAVVLAIAGIAVWRIAIPSSNAPSVATLVAAAPRDARTIEPRLAGGFAWATYVGPKRAAANSADEKELQLSGLAGAAVAAAHKTNNASAEHVAGVAMLLAGKEEAAVPLLEETTRRESGDPRAWNDLAAAEYARAIASDESSRYALALGDADRALRLDPRFAEALFNRALILERMGLIAEARRAWQRYLEIDSSSPWAAEARERMAKLPSSSASRRFEQDQPRLELAATNGDAATVLAIVRDNPERSRAFGEAEYLGRWGDSVAAHDDATAARNLTIARAIGNALVVATGESLLHDSVAAIDGASPPQRAALAEAHALYRRGRIAYARRLLAEGEAQLRDAAARFGGSPMARVARYYAANARFDQGDVAAARAQLDQLLRELDATPRYIALGAQVRWELAICHNAIDDWPGALSLLERSAAMFGRLGERSNLGFIETLRADTLAACGRPDDSAAARIRSFSLASEDQRGDRLPISIAVAATSELSTGRRDAARALLEVAQSAARASNDGALRVDILMQSALLEAEGGDAREALRQAAAATQAAAALPDPSLRERAAAEAQLASAAAELPEDAGAARRLAGEAVAYFSAKGLAVHLPLAHLLRARAELRLGARDDAARDLDEGIAALEGHQVQIAGALASPEVLEASNNLFDDAISLAVARGDRAAVFDTMQREQAATPSARVPLGEVQQRLGGTALLSIAVLPQRIVTLTVTARDAIVTGTPVDRRHLTDLVARGDDAALRELYDLLIRPVEPAIDSSQRLIVIPDKALESVPFAALLDAASRPLVARMPVARAANMTSLYPGGHSAPRRLAAIALPSGAATAALPESREEIADIASAYPRATVLPADADFAAFARAAADADVVHVAGHTERVAADDALAFAGGETVTWRTAAACALQRHPIVVLSACETLRRPASLQNRALSIGAGFIGGGASEVIGTLAPISDRAARELFASIHRDLAKGIDAADAVRDAQLDAIARRDLPASDWRAIAVLTTRID